MDSASRTIGSVKSKASSADLPMSRELEARLQSHLEHHSAKHENRRGRPLCADKLREKQLHPLLEKLLIEKSGFHAMRHGAASALLADGASLALPQGQLRHSDPRSTLAVYAHVLGDQQRTAAQNRSARLVN